MSSDPSLFRNESDPPSDQLQMPSVPSSVPSSAPSRVQNRSSQGPSSQGLNTGSQPTTGGFYPMRSSQNTPRSSAFARGDLRSFSSSRSLHLPSNNTFGSEPMGLSSGSGNAEVGEKMVIWGTLVNIQDCMEAFEHFLYEFKAGDRRKYDAERLAAARSMPASGFDEEKNLAIAHAQESTSADAATRPANERVYIELIREMLRYGETTLNLDILDLVSFHVREGAGSMDLADSLIKYPQEVIPLFDGVVHNVAVAEYKRAAGIVDTVPIYDADQRMRLEEMETRVYRIRPYGMAKHTNMRDLNPSDIDKIVSVKGLVIRTTPLVPEMKQAYFACNVCNKTEQVLLDRAKIKEPQRCPNPACAQQGSMRLIHNRSDFADRQVVRMQETPDIVPAGQTPHSVNACVHDELVDSCKPGDRVIMTAVYRSVPVRVNPAQRTVKRIFKTYLDVCHVDTRDMRRVNADADEEDQVAEYLATGDPADRDAMDVDGTSARGHSSPLATPRRTRRRVPTASSPDVPMPSDPNNLSSSPIAPREAESSTQGGSSQGGLNSGGLGSGGLNSGGLGSGGLNSEPHTAEHPSSALSAQRTSTPGATRSSPSRSQGSPSKTRVFTETEKHRFDEIAQTPNLFSYLARSLAPNIYEMDDVKKGILLMLLGGTHKVFTRAGAKQGPRYRGDINVLIVGDPGTSKSQLLQYVHRISARGVYTSGKGSSAVGLTAYVTRDPDSRQLVLESGALVLSDGGVCCIDEFDKMSDSTRSVLHEVMEQQTVSVAKAGIITTLNARTSVLAAANPRESTYNDNVSLQNNINLPPSLLSRFDLVYVLHDTADSARDSKLAKHVLSLYRDNARTVDTPAPDTLAQDELTSYISYARENIQPHISPPASTRLTSEYLAMRRAAASNERLQATTRQLESMIRLSEAHARMRLSEVVDEADVAEAARLITYADTGASLHSAA